ncbi:MAG: hypothetical protein Q9206_003813 [Seirophora lacunosa]
MQRLRITPQVWVLHEQPKQTQMSRIPHTPTRRMDDSAESAHHESPSRFEEDAPAYNPKNLTCDEYLGIRNPADKWSATDGDNAVHGFLEMFNSDKLFCAECFGHSKDECDSKSTACTTRIASLAPNECASAPVCEDLNGGDGVSSAAFLQSISNAYLSFQSNYEAIQEAGHDCDKQMAKFSDVFAPVPSSHGDVIGIIIATSLLAGLLSFMGMYAGAIGGIALGLGTGLGMDAMFSSKPGSQDTAGPLGLIVDRVLENFGQLTNKLFQDGEYTQPNSDGTADVSITLQNMTRDGKLVSPDMDPKSHFMGLKPTYRRFLYQQLALITWQTLEVDGETHVPFIAFDTVPCAEVDPDDEKSVSNSHLDGIEDLDVQVDFQGQCYYLLDAFPKAYAARTSTNRCNGARHLPGGTHKTMKANSEEFAKLSLEDFVIPSVLGWQQHSKTNGYASAGSNGNLIKDPQQAGAVNIPICDYVANAKSPGVGCPRIFEITGNDKQCALVPASEGKNPPDAAKPLEVDNTALPYNLIVAAGALDVDPVSFWYADQYWTSKETDEPHSCKGGKDGGDDEYANGARNMDCNFDCPLLKPEDGDPPASATVDHPLPATPVQAVAGVSSFANTYSKPAGPAPAAATPTYVSGVCPMIITQYQKHEKKSNPSNDFQVEISVKDSEGNQAAYLPKKACPIGEPVTMKGLRGGDFNVIVGKDLGDERLTDYTPLSFTYSGQGFDTNRLKCRKGKDGQYQNGDRELDCNIKC